MSRSLRSRPDARRLVHLLLFVACASVVLSLSAVAAGARSRHPRCKKHHSATCARSPKKRGAGPRAPTAAQRAPVLSVRGKTLKWNRIGTANSYVIATTVGSDRAHTAYKAVTGTSYTPPAAAAKSVHYVVRVNQSGSPWSNEVTLTYPVGSNPPPPTPTPSAPDASFTFSPGSPATGEEVTFDGRSSTCAATPCTYTWVDVGAGGTGSWPLGSGQAMAFTFQDPGTKYVRLSVRDAQGRSDTMTKNVVVQAAPPPPTSPPPTTTPPPGSSCTTTVSSTAAAQTAVASAAPGSTVCLADGSYGKLTLNATKAAPGVTVRPVTSGGATIAGATLTGQGLTIARFRSTDTILLPVGDKGMTVSHNHLVGGYFGVVAGDNTGAATVDNTLIEGNKFDAQFGEDSIRADRYEGLMIRANEFVGNFENGNHNDCFQAVWTGNNVTFDHNYLHDNHCQGFFIKDQANGNCTGGNVCGPVNNVVVTDNLFLRNQGYQEIHLFGPINGLTMNRNTIAGDPGDTGLLRDPGWTGPMVIRDNYFQRAWIDNTTETGGLASSGNQHCESFNKWSLIASTTNCRPAFTNVAADDYRIPGGPGVDWKPSDYHYGP